MIDKRQAQNALWHRGKLQWLLQEHQLPIYHMLWDVINSNDPTETSYVINCARRYGKTFILCVIAIEFALQKKKRLIRFAAPTGSQLSKACWPSLDKIFETCPIDLLPKLNKNANLIEFKNGSQIHFAGTDAGNAERLRGSESHLNLLDEAGFMDDLQYVYSSILMPQTLHTLGRTIFASTPPTTPDHDYVDLYREHAERGRMAQFTIYDNTSLSEDSLTKAIAESGGIESTTFKREYLCEFVVDDQLQLIHQWSADYEKDVDKDEYYYCYHKYVGMDLGTRDSTVALFGYYDYLNARLVVEEELVMNGPTMTTDILARDLKEAEERLWLYLKDEHPLSVTQAEWKPRVRISDNSLGLMLQDLSILHGIHFNVTNKDSLEAMVNKVRIWAKSGRIIVSPKCEQLIGCLNYGIWSSRHTGAREFARSKVYGHYDALAALVYLVRNIDENTNPVPATHGFKNGTWYSNRNQSPNQAATQLAKMFRPVTTK